MHTQLQQTHQKARATQLFALSFLAVAACMLMVTPAYAVTAVDTPMGDVLCAIVGFIYGNLGRGLATLAVIVVGVGATLGKVSWGLAITVAVGVAVIFNAHSLVQELIGGATPCA